MQYDVTKSTCKVSIGEITFVMLYGIHFVSSSQLAFLMYLFYLYIKKELNVSVFFKFIAERRSLFYRTVICTWSLIFVYAMTLLTVDKCQLTFSVSRSGLR